MNDVVDSTSDLNKKTYPTMLKLISGTLVGEMEYDSVYEANDDENDDDTNQTTGCFQRSISAIEKKVPTLCEIARKVAKQQKTVLDEKQYIAYEIIACTFLMGLVQDGIDNSTDLG